MEDYQRKAINRGDAIDAYKFPEKVREFVEERIGFMRDGFNDIDKKVDEFVESARQQGVVFNFDLFYALNKFMMENSSKYIKNIIKNELNKIKENTDK